MRLPALVLLAALSACAEEHPRVLFRAKAADGCPGLDEILGKAKVAPWKDRVGDLLQTTHGKALHWLITGDEASAKACLADMKALGPDDGYGLYALGPILYLPLAYDWLFPWEGFSAADKKEIAAKIEKTADASVEFLKGASDSVWHTSAPRSLMGIALAGAALDGAKASEYTKFARQYFEGTYAPCMAALDGGAVAGMSYGVAESFQPLCHGLWAMKTAHGLDEFAWVKERGNWLELRLEYMAYQCLPDFTWPRWGDCVGGSRASLKDEVRGVIDMLARGTGSATGAWLSRRVGGKFAAHGAYHSSVLPDFFVFGKAWEEADPALPPAKLFGRETIGQAVFRSGWGADDTVVFFKAGDYFDNHGHFDQGSFTIFRKGHLALDSGAYGDFNAPHRMEYARKTVAHNVILFGSDADGGQRIVSSQDSQDWADHQRKKKSKGLEGAEVVAFETGDGWAYVSASLASAYDPKIVGLYTRELVWLDEGIVVVLDKTASRAVPRWLLHTAEEPKVEESSFTASGLWCATLYPERVALSKVGPGCLVDGKDFPAAESSYGVPGAWRVEVRGGNTFLHVLSALDAAPAVELKRDGDLIGVSVSGKTVLFRKEGIAKSVVIR